MATKKQRSDAWTEEMDNFLAETTLAHLREGKTAKDAFTVVGNEYDKTDSAVQFRWNSVVRNHYTKDIKLARKQGTKVKKERANAKKAAATTSKSAEQLSPSIMTTNDMNQEAIPQVAPTQLDSDFMTLALNHFQDYRALKTNYLEKAQEAATFKAQYEEVLEKIESTEGNGTNSEEFSKLQSDNEELKRQNQEQEHTIKDLQRQLSNLKEELGEYQQLAAAIRSLDKGNGKESSNDDESGGDTIAS